MNLSCNCHRFIWSTEHERLEHEAKYWKRRYEAKCIEAKLFKAAHHRLSQGWPGETYERRRATKLRQLIKKEQQEVEEASRQLTVIVRQQWEALREEEEAAQRRIDRQLNLIAEREERLATVLAVEE